MRWNRRRRRPRTRRPRSRPLRNRPRPRPRPPRPATTTAPSAALAPTRPPVSPEPPLPPSADPFERRGADIRFRFGERVYRVRGLEKNADVRQLVVNVMVVQGDLFHQDKLDMSLALKRLAFTRQAAIELGQGEDVLKKEVGRILLALEELQNEEAQAARAPEKREVQMSAAEREDALALLSDPRLLDRVLEDFLACAVVGEETNKLVGRAAACQFGCTPINSAISRAFPHRSASDSGRAAASARLRHVPMHAETPRVRGFDSRRRLGNL